LRSRKRGCILWRLPSGVPLALLAPKALHMFPGLYKAIWGTLTSSSKPGLYFSRYEVYFAVFVLAPVSSHRPIRASCAELLCRSRLWIAWKQRSIALCGFRTPPKTRDLGALSVSFSLPGILAPSVRVTKPLISMAVP